MAPEMTQLEFPFLEELYLRRGEPKWINFLRAPHLASLHMYGFIPSDLRHISNSTISSIHLEFGKHNPGLREIHLPSADKLQLDVEISDLFCLNVYPSQFQFVVINTNWEECLCPPFWVVDYVSNLLGTVTELNIGNEHLGRKDGYSYPSQRILSFLKPFAYLKHLKLLWGEISGSACVDQLAQLLPDPEFLPELEALSISEYPSWPEFFRYIQQRQTGFITGRCQTSLKAVTIKGPVHGALLEHLRGSLAGLHTSLINIPPRRKGSKEWPAQPFERQGFDTDGLLCCYVCHKAGLEMGAWYSLQRTWRRC